MKIVSVMIVLACSWSPAVRADGSLDHSSVAAMLKAVQVEQMDEKMREQMAQFKDEVNKKDETIAALKAKTEHRQVQLTAGGEVMQLVSEAYLKELAARVAACEKTNHRVGVGFPEGVKLLHVYTEFPRTSNFYTFTLLEGVRAGGYFSNRELGIGSIDF